MTVGFTFRQTDGKGLSCTTEIVESDRYRGGIWKSLVLTTSRATDGRSNKDIFEGEIQHGTEPVLFTSLWAKYQRGCEPWRFVVAHGALSGGTVLLINLICLVVIYARFEVRDNSAVMYSGSCSISSQTVTGLHVLINVLSMILLSCSNYSMQCLISPSRSEIDAAHAQKRWLSVGVQNVRNLFFVSRSKSLLWIVLGLSSVPLHLLWNSTVFETFATHNYVAVSVTEDFLQGAHWSSFASLDVDRSVEKLQRAAQANELERLDDSECIQAYAQYMQYNRRDVLLVSNASSLVQLNGTSTSAFAAYSIPFMVDNSMTFTWMCDRSVFFEDGNGYYNCNIPYLQSFAAGSAHRWVPGGQVGSTGVALGNQQNLTVAYCLSEVVPEECSVNVAPLLLGVVIACNVVKIAAFLATLYINRKQPPLVTTGDAIQSFLESPDLTTTGRCLVSKEDYETLCHRSCWWKRQASLTGDVWHGRRLRWGKAARWYTWWSFLIPASITVGIAGGYYSPDNMNNVMSVAWPITNEVGIGKPQPGLSLYRGASLDLITAVVTANSPQLLVTYIYLFYNNLMTTMLAMSEWCGFASAPAKGLRVSNPKQDTAQRATYYLQVPYRYGIPSMVLIATLHWLTSQMVFMAKINVYNIRGEANSDGSITSVFFSPLAMLPAVSLASALLIVLFAVAIFAKYPEHVPLSAGCSASLAAACQPNRGREFEEVLSLRPLVWGVTDLGGGLSGPGHATFSDATVGTLTKGESYA